MAVFINDDRFRLGVVPRVFLAHAAGDAPLVTAIADFLSPFPMPMFMTGGAVIAGEKWEGRLTGDLAEATTVYVFWSARAAAGPRVAAEADQAIGAGKLVVPVRIDDAPMPRHVVAAKCIDVRFVSGPNAERYDGGFTNGLVIEGRNVLTKLAVPFGQLLSEMPWPKPVNMRPDGYLETDYRLIAAAMCAALR